MILKLKRTPGIYILGFMGAGKTTVGRLLADELGWHFADIDDDIEHQQHKTIPELFGTLGEEQFRRIEHEAIARRVKSIRSGKPMVVSLGGGAFTRAENIDLLTDNGITIWIDTDFQILKRRVQFGTHRPLARDSTQFETLYNSRREHYAKAEYRVELHEDNSRLAVQHILQLPLFR